MQQVLDFASNHPLLSGGFVAVLVLLAWTEVQRRRQGFRTVATSEAVSLINRDRTAVVDVSSAADFEKGHIVDAVNLPMSRLDASDPEVRKLQGRPVLVTCKNGQASPQAASALVKLGAGDVAVLKGGMAQWKSDQYPVTRGAGKRGKS